MASERHHRHVLQSQIGQKSNVSHLHITHCVTCVLRTLLFHKITHACVRHDLNQSVLEEQFLSILQCAQVADESWLVAGEESGGEGEE